VRQPEQNRLVSGRTRKRRFVETAVGAWRGDGSAITGESRSFRKRRKSKFVECRSAIQRVTAVFENEATRYSG
jgi:hypothetical protein